jgi:hypothetical protein
MNRQPCSAATRRIAAFAGHTLLLLGLALPAAQAQQTPASQLAKDLVPFRATWTAQTQPVPIATDPMIVVFPNSIVMGQSDLFGAFTGVAISTQRLGVDGKPLTSTVVTEWTTANGDALSIEIPAIVYLPQTTPGGPLFEGALVVTNGKGRFLGARGSAFIKGVIQTDPVTGKGVVTLLGEGLITRPK